MLFESGGRGQSIERGLLSGVDFWGRKCYLALSASKIYTTE